MKKTKKRKCKKPKKKKQYGKGKIYTTDGLILHTDITYKGIDLFRKNINVSKSYGNTELEIYKILNENPNENIVNIYNIGDDYVDLEMLNTDLSSFKISDIKEAMIPVKDYLQSLGIVYIDWKPDNIGISEDGNLKLFDFDVSGIIDTNNPKKWIMKPPEWFSYKKAIESGMKTPIEIDNYAFNIWFD
jgi:serine/threonine protein kinase